MRICPRVPILFESASAIFLLVSESLTFRGLYVYGYMGAKLMCSVGPPRLLGPACLGDAPLRSACFHYFIAFSAATAFFLPPGPFRSSPHAALLASLLRYAVYFFMNRIVVPLSAATNYPFSMKMRLIGVVIHIFCIGLPIALTIKKRTIR
jgi:hypothetical protein